MWTCKNCNEENEDSFEICWNCGQDSGINQDKKKPSKKTIPEQKEVDPEKSIEMKQKYPALSIISNVSKFLAWIILIVSIILSIIQIANSPNIFSISSTLLVGIVCFLIILALSELIVLFIDIEKNTRNIRK